MEYWHLALALLAILVPSIWIWLDYSEKKRKSQYELVRNVIYRPLPNLFFETLKKSRFEILTYKNILEHGKVFGADLLSNKNIVIAEPELLQIVLSKQFTNFTNRRVTMLLLDALINTILFLVAIHIFRSTFQSDVVDCRE